MTLYLDLVKMLKCLVANIINMFDRKKIIDDIIEDINSIKRKMGHEARSFFVNSEITNAQWIVVKAIRHLEGANIKEIADNLGVTSSAVTQLVDGLVKKGYLERGGETNDRRVMKLVLTDKTKEQAAEINNRFRRIFPEMFDSLNDEEVEEYLKLSRKIINNLK